MRACSPAAVRRRRRMRAGSGALCARPQLAQRSAQHRVHSSHRPLHESAGSGAALPPPDQIRSVQIVVAAAAAPIQRHVAVRLRRERAAAARERAVAAGLHHVLELGAAVCVQMCVLSG